MLLYNKNQDDCIAHLNKTAILLVIEKAIGIYDTYAEAKSNVFTESYLFYTQWTKPRSFLHF